MALHQTRRDAVERPGPARYCIRSSLSLRLSLLAWVPSARAAERAVEVLEHRPSARQALLVVRRSVADARDDRLDPLGLRSGKFPILEIDVMDDFGDPREPAVGLEASAREKHLESAPIPLMRELRVEHVEPELGRFGGVSLRGDEFEPGLRVDEAADEPSRSDAVDEHARPGDPGSALELAK